MSGTSTAPQRLELGRRTIILIVSLILSAVLMEFAISGILLERRFSLNVLVFIATALLILINPFLARTPGRIRIASFLVVSEIYAIIGIIAAHNGGSTAPAFLWNAFLPLLAIYLLGPPGGLVFVIGVVGELAVFLFLESRGHAFTRSVPDSILSRIRIISLFTLPIINWLIGSTYELSRTLALEGTLRALRFLRKANRNLRHARDEAFRANSAKDTFLASMSHEIRTPMQTILGFTEALQESQIDETQKEYLQIIHSSASSLLAFLNEILDVSRIRAGEMQLEEQPFDLVKAIDDITASFRKHFEYRNLFLEKKIEPGTPGVIVGDLRRFSEILTNLLANSSRFTESGGTRVVVRPTAGTRTSDRIADDSRWIEIVVTDSGIGVPANKQREIFQSFRQAHSSASGSSGGVGLGLAIVDGIVRLMGGTIELESPVADPVASNGAPGSRFRVLLPVHIAHADALPMPERISPAPEIAVTARILIAEDNPDTQLLLKRFLVRSNILVDVAINGREAVRLARENHYDLVLMDLQMPEMDGIEACKEIRKAGLHSLPIIALTANAFESDRRKAHEAGMNDFLPKPFHRAELLGLLDRWLQKRDDRKE